MSTLKVTLKWKNQMSTEDSIRIYKSLTPFDLEAMPDPYVTLLPGTNTYEDLEVENGIDYYYIISAVKDNIEKFSSQKLFNPQYLDLGPGSSVLVGHGDTAGFFGQITAANFITGDALASMIGLTGGTSQNNTTPWLKFFIDDKILYVPKMTHRHSISWDQIHAVNAVYGDREVDIQGYRFKIRLLQGINSGESVTNTNGFDLPITHQSEWNRLFYPISAEHTNEAYHKLSQVGPNWVTYTQEELNINTGNGRYTWCQETPSNGPTTRAFRGYLAVSYLYWYTSSSANTYYGWRACLELVSD